MSKTHTAGQNSAVLHSSSTESSLSNGNMRVSVLEDVRHTIVMACDEAYAMPLATALRSIAESNGRNDPVDVYVLTTEFSERLREKVLDSLPKGAVSVRWIPVELAAFGDFSTLPHISKMTFARLLIPSVLPDNLAKVLYLDADLLVLNDLRPLFHTDMNGAVLGAVLDRADPLLKAGKLHIDGIPKVRDYFNAGVLLIDLNRWREEKVSERAFEYLDEHPLSPMSDQDALNVACDGQWNQLDPRWNYQQNRETRLSDMSPEQRPAVFHFLDRLKPWDSNSLSPNAKFYDRIRNRTCFARTLRDKAQDTLKDWWLRLKRMLKSHGLVRVIWRRFKGRERDHLDSRGVPIARHP